MAVLRQVLTVLEVSPFYPNRGASTLGRIYLETTEPPCDCGGAHTTDPQGGEQDG